MGQKHVDRQVFFDLYKGPRGPHLAYLTHYSRFGKPATAGRSIHNRPVKLA